jgi:SAM-dependent methyltransferase
MTQDVYVPTREERVRQEFVLGLKLLANGAAQRLVRAEYRERVLPQQTQEQGATPTERRQVAAARLRTEAFRMWAVLTHHSQSMMWDAVERTTQRVLPSAERRYAALRAQPERCRGSLQLDSTLAVPPPISNTEIHRQPGGFAGRADIEDVSPGLRYIGASLIYGAGKGQEHATGDARASVLLGELRWRYPNFAPRRILDLGCGIGVHSQALALAFPQAEYHGVDVAAGLLRFAHLIAEERGIGLHLHQRDAARTGFEDGSFDLVLSNILFHETNSARLPQILRECRRLLRPGGVMLHVDVATQTSRHGFDDQLMNDWQVRWYGEPFWTGFAERDLFKEIVAAGFSPKRSFAEYLDRPGGASYVFGAIA